MLKNIPRDKVLESVQRRGPVLPIHIVKELGGDTILAGAVLSDLAGAKKILITNTKRGGSPFYYVKEQTPKLELLSVYLDEKERRVFEQLKKEKVLKDNNQDTLTRVCLRKIKDYSIPIMFKNELYWKYFLVSNEEAQQLLTQPEKTIEVPVTKQEPIERVTAQQQLPVKKLEKLKKPRKPRETKPPFIDTIKTYFEEKNILIKETKTNSKTDIDLIVAVPSAIGHTTYYCKGRDKKKINDGDLAIAALRGQERKLPILIVSTGDLTKKATIMLNKEFTNMNFLRV